MMVCLFFLRFFFFISYYVNCFGQFIEGSQIIPEIANSPIVSIHRLPVIKNEGGLPFILFAIKKVILQHYYLLSLLWKLRGAEYLLVQVSFF